MSIVSKSLFALALCFSVITYSSGQTTGAADSAQALGLRDCIDYALKHQPRLNQALIGVEVARSTNAINLSGWLPQAGVSANLTHYNTLPTSFVKNANDSIVKQRTGVVNTFVPVLSVTQTIFNPSLFYAARSAHLYIDQAMQITDSTKIYAVATVSQAFYNLLLTLAQINVLKEDTARLAKQLHDTYHQYVAGTVDQTDYNEAAISLNNSNAQLRQAVENVFPQYATLKQVMGMPSEQKFNIVYDTTQMMQDIQFDTTQALEYKKRIEYKQLLTSQRLQDQQIGYYSSAWLPTVGAFFNYDLAFQNNNFGSLFDNNYPYSYMGISVSVPIFTGFARTQSLRRARLERKILDWSEVDLKSQIYTEYANAMASFKGNRYNLDIMRDNEDLARKTYDIVFLQYQQGVVPYLNVITAESNLVSSEIGYQNALFQLLSSKIDLEKAMGIIVVK